MKMYPEEKNYIKSYIPKKYNSGFYHEFNQ